MIGARRDVTNHVSTIALFLQNHLSTLLRQGWRTNSRDCGVWRQVYREWHWETISWDDFRTGFSNTDARTKTSLIIVTQKHVASSEEARSAAVGSDSGRRRQRQNKRCRRNRRVASISRSHLHHRAKILNQPTTFYLGVEASSGDDCLSQCTRRS